MQWTKGKETGQPQDNTAWNSEPRSSALDKELRCGYFAPFDSLYTSHLPKSTAATRLRVEMSSMVSYLSSLWCQPSQPGSPCLHPPSRCYPQSSQLVVLPADNGLGELKHRLFQRSAGCLVSRTLPRTAEC